MLSYNFFSFSFYIYLNLIKGKKTQTKHQFCHPYTELPKTMKDLTSDLLSVAQGQNYGAHSEDRTSYSAETDLARQVCLSLHQVEMPGGSNSRGS